MADFTGGYDPAFDWPLQAKPDNPEMRESVSFWVSDDQGRFGFPRMCVEVVAGTWEDRGVEANIAFPDGRVLIGSGGFAPKPDPKVAGGKVVELNAGPLTFELVEPLKRWVMTYDGPARESTVQRSMKGEVGGPAKHVRIRVEAEAAAPAWSPGAGAAKSGDASTAKAVGAVGGHRHEQLFRCTGVFEVEGEETRTFTGTGLKIRRTGVRDVGAFPGHCWMSAVFPSGKAFCILAFPERSDGTPAFSEALLYENGQVTSGVVTKAPWMTSFVPHGGDVGLEIRTTDGRKVVIDGKTHDSTFLRAGVPMFGDWLQPKDGSPPVASPLPFHQGGAHYAWDGESAYGMIERSLPMDKFKG